MFARTTFTLEPRFFDQELGFNHTIDFFAPDQLNDQLNDWWTYFMPDYYSTGFGWEADESSPGAPSNRESELIVGIRTALEKETDRLAGIAISWGTVIWKHDFTPERVLEELGTPDWGYAATDPIQSDTQNYEQTHLALFYRQGLAFYFSSVVATVTSNNGEFTPLCLGAIESQHSGTIYITSPYSNELSDLSALQQRVVGFSITASELLPIEEVSNTTEQELYDLAISQDNPCVEIPVSPIN